MKVNIILIRVLLLYFFFNITNSIAYSTVWLANGNDIKIYDHSGNYLDGFIAGTANSGGIAVVDEPNTLLLFGLGGLALRKRRV